MVWQVSHLAQMKSVYPEVISLRYADIPKTSMHGQCSGTQLIIDMSLSDSAAEPASTLKSVPAAPSQSALGCAGAKPHDQEAGPAAVTAPSSTQAALKAGATVSAVGLLSGGQMSVNKAGTVMGDRLESEGQVVDSPGDPLGMMAIKAEFERRLEKQVSIYFSWCMHCVHNVSYAAFFCMQSCAMPALVHALCASFAAGMPLLFMILH